MKDSIRTTYLEWDGEGQEYLRLSTCLDAEVNEPSAFSVFDSLDVPTKK